MDPKYRTNMMKYTTSCKPIHLIKVGHVLLSVLASLGSLALEEVLSVLVELKVHNLDLGGIQTQLAGRTVNLLLGDSLNVDDPLLSVHLGDLSLSTLVSTTDNLHLISLDHGDGVHLELIERL